jgi:coproporphyrinogen III oxidase-like Fe-S oxidoreductase
VARQLSIARHVEAGLLEERGGHLRHTPEGRMLASQVAMDLL